MAPSHCAFSNGFEFLEKFGVLEKKRFFFILKFLKNVSYQDFDFFLNFDFFKNLELLKVLF